MTLYGDEFYINMNAKSSNDESFLDLATLATFNVQRANFTNEDNYEEAYDEALSFTGTLEEFKQQYPTSYDLGFKNIVTQKFVLLFEVYTYMSLPKNHPIMIASFRSYGSDIPRIANSYFKSEGYTLNEIASIVLKETLEFYRQTEQEITKYQHIRFSILPGYKDCCIITRSVA